MTFPPPPPHLPALLAMSRIHGSELAVRTNTTVDNTALALPKAVGLVVVGESVGLAGTRLEERGGGSSGQAGAKRILARAYAVVVLLIVLEKGKWK